MHLEPVVSQDESDSPRLYEDRSSQSTKQQTSKTVHHWAAEVKLDDYYANMMVAWYLATGLAKNYDSFVKAIEERKFDTVTHNKTIQKAVESYCVSENHKEYLKTLKAK